MSRIKAWTITALVTVIAIPLIAVSQGLIDGSKILGNGYFLIRDSYLRVGVGSTPAITLGGDDAFIEGTLEVDGAARLDGGVSAVLDRVIFCGENAENGTIFFGPATALFGGDGSDYSLGSVNCDALDNATEATADAPILTAAAFQVMGFRCKTDGTLGAGESIVFTLRSAAADLTPSVTCTISEAETECSDVTSTSTDVAAGATVAMKVVEASNNADDNAWCQAVIAIR